MVLEILVFLITALRNKNFTFFYSFIYYLMLSNKVQLLYTRLLFFRCFFTFTC